MPNHINCDETKNRANFILYSNFIYDIKCNTPTDVLKQIILQIVQYLSEYTVVRILFRTKKMAEQQDLSKLKPKPTYYFYT